MANYSDTISCAEEAGSVNESYDDDRGIMKASVQLRCAWADRHLLVADICGNRKAWPKGAAGVSPKAATASISPVLTPGSPASDQQEVIYGEALVTINYTTEIVDVVSESIEPFAEFITLDFRNFLWGSGSGTPLREEEAPGRLIRGINFVRTELDKTGALDPSVLSLIGNVNNAPVVGSILSLTFATGTLLYAPPSISYKKDSSGTTKFDLTKKFTYQAHGWNSYFRPSTATFQEIFVAGASTSYKSYPVSNLAGLFT